MTDDKTITTSKFNQSLSVKTNKSPPLLGAAITYRSNNHQLIQAVFRVEHARLFMFE